jgi:hypothetical protein
MAMQRLNRSAHASVGTVFFLFLGLAIIPVSLRAVGVQISFTPRLSAAADALQQIADAFGASYHPAPTSELCVVRDPDIDLLIPPDGSACARSRQFACNQARERCVETVPAVPKVRTQKPNPPLRASAVLESRRSVANRFVVFVAAEAIKASFEKNASIAALGAMKPQREMRERLIRMSEGQQVIWKSLEPIGDITNRLVPKNGTVVVRMKRAAAGSSTKPAQCKVFAALASARKQDCERAMLTGIQSANPDNSEF